MDLPPLGLVAATATATARARRRAGHLVAGGGDRVPAGAERVHALAARVAGALVAGEGVDRVAVVGHLRLAVGARCRSHDRGGRAAADRRLAARPRRGAGIGACCGAGALCYGELREPVKGGALLVI